MTIDALSWLGSRQRASATGYMFGLDNFVDGPCATDYDPWVHAETLGLPLITRAALPNPKMVACYSSRCRAVFVKPGLSRSVERCAIAHEIVHHEYADVGTTRHQEDRADRVAAHRLIRPGRLYEIGCLTDDLARIALELEVTERIMKTYLRERR